MSFESDLKRGRKGEEMFERAMQVDGESATNVTGQEAYQGADIDYVDSCGGGWEVKTDYMLHRTGNLALESFTSTRGDSWLWTSKADIFVFAIPQTDEVYAIDARLLRILCKEPACRRISKYDFGKEIELILLPFDKYREAFVPLPMGVNEKKCA